MPIPRGRKNRQPKQRQQEAPLLAPQAPLSLAEGQPDQAGPVRLLVVDGEQLFRQGLRSVLEKSGAACVVAEATGLEEACAAVRRTSPEVVVADCRLPGEDEGATIAELVRQWPALPVVVVTDTPPEECLYGLLQVGAQGFVMKSAPAQLVALALAAVRAGEIWVQREALTRAIRSMRKPAEQADTLKAPLTAREQEVLTLLATGATTAEIAGTLFITESTVRVHALRLAEKLRAKSRVEAVRRALRLGLVKD